MPRLIGYFWKVHGTNCCGKTYFCCIAKTQKEAEDYARDKGYKNPYAELWPDSQKKGNDEKSNVDTVGSNNSTGLPNETDSLMTLIPQPSTIA